MVTIGKLWLSLSALRYNFSGHIPFSRMHLDLFQVARAYDGKGFYLHSFCNNTQSNTVCQCRAYRAEVKRSYNWEYSVKTDTVLWSLFLMMSSMFYTGSVQCPSFSQCSATTFSLLISVALIAICLLVCVCYCSLSSFNISQWLQKSLFCSETFALWRAIGWATTFHLGTVDSHEDVAGDLQAPVHSSDIIKPL